MLWGATLRSPHPRARIRGDRHRARRWPCRACTPCSPTRTCRGARRTGSSTTTSPCWRSREVRYQGEPVAIVAADHPGDRAPRGRPDRGRLRGARAAGRPRVRARRPTRRRCIPAGNLLRHVHIAHGDGAGRGRRRGHAASTRSGCRTRRSSGPESGLAMPAEDGGIDLFIATQWLHVDRDQVAACLDLPRGEGALHAGRRRRRVRRARGRLDAGPRLHARAAHRPAGEDGLRARGVVLRARPPASGADALRARRDPRRAAGVHPRADPARRRRLRLLLDARCARTPRRSRSARTRCRARGSTPTSSTPTTRRAGRCAGSAPSRPASRTRRRWTSSRRRWGWTRSSCGCATR